MAYVDQRQDINKRAAAIAGVAAIHAALGLAVVTGLTVSGFVPPIDTWDPFTLTPEAKVPPPPPPQPRTEQKEHQDSFITAPPTPFPPPAPTSEWAKVDTTPDETPLVIDPGTKIEPVTDPRPTLGFTPRPPRPRNQPSSWLSPDDYPRGPLVDGVEGSAAYRLIVSTTGKVSACDVTRSTGNPQLDAATCRYIERRARFEPATDETGAKVMGSYTGNVKWEIPE